MVFFNNINYTFDNIDYVKTIIVFFFIFGFINSYETISSTNIIALIIAGILTWYFIQNKVSNRLDDYQRLENQVGDLGLDRFPYLKTDIIIVNSLFNVLYLNRISRIDFYNVLKHLDHFFLCVSQSQNTNLDSTSLYEIGRHDLFLALNELTAFVPKLRPKLTLESTESNFEYDEDTLYTKLMQTIAEIRNRSQIYLDKMETKSNKKWINGDVNVYTRPIYPGNPEASNLTDFDHNNFVIQHS
jgi:hypothetical protein